MFKIYFPYTGFQIKFDLSKIINCEREIYEHKHKI